jgi:hypothetical protein
MVKKFYDKAYQKAVYCDQTYIERVLNYLLANNFQHLFKTRYMIAGYDMYLRNDHRSPAAGIHTDLPNFHHFYETENDMSLYIPLVDLDEKNGGRITVLPEDKLKVPGNILLKLLREHFAMKTDCLDENGYIDPEKISAKSMSAFIKSAAHQNLMGLYKNLINIAKKQYANAFQTAQETKGKVLLFNNKNFHAAEPWKNQSFDREVYVIRMFPIYDANIKLKRTLHDKLINNFLVDTVTGAASNSNFLERTCAKEAAVSEGNCARATLFQRWCEHAPCGLAEHRFGRHEPKLVQGAKSHARP